MPVKKDYSYENTINFLLRYGCELRNDKAYFDTNPQTITILSNCKHTVNVSFNKLFKHKHGIYCEECLQKKLILGTTCMNKICNKEFTPTETLFLYCSRSCSSSRKMPDEQRRKLTIHFNRVHGNLDENGDPISDLETSQLYRKNKRNKIRNDERRDIGIPEKKFYTYDVVKKTIEQKGCMLLTTEEDFKKNEKIRFFKIQTSCGHINEKCNIVKFASGKHGTMCFACVCKQTSENAIKNSKNSDGILNTMTIENKGYNIIKKMLEEKFLVTRTRECCLADILIKPKTIMDDKWIQIQLKITNKLIHENYSFILKKNYGNMHVLLLCIADNKIWLGRGHELYDSRPMLRIGKTKSKYDKYHIDNEKIQDVFSAMYSTNADQLISFDAGNTPQTKNAQKEYEYVKLREKSIDFIEFTNNEIDGLVYDFKIGDKKIQEKVCGVKTTKIASLSKTLRENKITKRVPYEQYDNDFYWLHHQDQNTFFVIPESVLIEKGFIKTTTQEGKKYLSTNKHREWLAQYKFHYDSINDETNKQKLLIMINNV
jgi:hypothetical protein